VAVFDRSAAVAGRGKGAVLNHAFEIVNEFIGFSFLVQAARDRIGSVGLGGNGQFNRLSALRSLGRPPWTDCLTEDLDIGLALVGQGWRIRFWRGAFVAQQGLRSPRLLLRQRTRWVQGNYQCMTHTSRSSCGPGKHRWSPASICVSTC